MSADLSQAEAYFNQARTAFTNRNWTEAVSKLDACLALAEPVADAHFMLATALVQLQQKERAIPHFKRCIELKPLHPEANLNLAVTLGQTGKVDEASGFLAKAAELGLPQARAMLSDLGMDYCRRCGSAVDIGKTSSPGAELNYIAPKIGLRCKGCDKTICQKCVPELATGVGIPRCPLCESDMAPLTR